MVSTLESGSSGPKPSQGHCVVFFGKSLNSHSASPPRNTGKLSGQPDKNADL